MLDNFEHSLSLLPAICMMWLSKWFLSDFSGHRIFQLHHSGQYYRRVSYHSQVTTNTYQYIPGWGAIKQAKQNDPEASQQLFWSLWVQSWLMLPASRFIRG